MQTEKIALDETDCFSPFFIDYIHEKDSLRPFYSCAPKIDHFDELIAQRNFQINQRAVLVDALERQYGELPSTDWVKSNIQSLRNENVFTITTGHQLNIFTGPLYFIYKIVTAINAAKALKKKFPEFHFVPVYWMATEDHDLAEINHFNLQGKKWQWETNQIGAVGRMTTEGLEKIIKQLPGDVSVFREAYLNEKNLAGACRHYVNTLFGEYGLVVVDGDDKELKKALIPVIEKDIFEHQPCALVHEQTKKLEALGYKSQVYCREINFFYLKDNIRARFEKQGERFVVVDTDISFSKTEIERLCKEKPECFSPNVILRPLYQELVLPNLAYIGGPAEMVYWLQLKSLFDAFNVPFPMLLPRNFGLIAPKNLCAKWAKTGLSTGDLFLNNDHLMAKYVKQQSNGALSFEKSLKAVQGVYENMKHQAEVVDVTLGPHIAALQKQAENRIHQAEKKLIRAEKRKQADRLRQITEVREALFPNNSLQERSVNFMEFSTDHSQFIRMLLDEFDAFDLRFCVVQI
jgi:bacillithiol synthase